MSKYITNVQELIELAGEPGELAKRKVITFIDKHCREYISKSPFLILSTADASGFLDASPRGDAPGFVLILDEKRLVIPERRGNKRMDSLKNIITNPQAGILFMIPGMQEALRVNGKARLTVDRYILRKMAVNGKVPVVGIEIEVDECFIQCGKAIKRSGLWQSESWPDLHSLPSAAEILAAHANLSGTTEKEIEEKLKDGYMNRLY